MRKKNLLNIKICKFNINISIINNLLYGLYIKVFKEWAAGERVLLASR